MQHFRARLAAAQQRAADLGIDALLVTPGPDLRYLTGYDAVPLERLTCLVVPRAGDIRLIAPDLERLAAQASPIGELGLEIVTWGELDDPYRLVATLAGAAGRIAVDNHMWAEKVLAVRDAVPAAQLTVAGPVLSHLRMHKDEAEIDALLRAGAAIDRVHADVPELLAAGRTEREVAADIAERILAAGHVAVDFIIVGSGPNGASPHHEVSDRVIQTGDVVVVDIGGTMPDGYRSDCTRTYAVGQPPEEFLDAYAVLQEAQAAAVAGAVLGVTCEGVDALARDVLAEHGLADLFVHRTGHGIGLETHEDPYIVSGNGLPLAPGMAFSVEPGFYVEGRYGARIEDIVIASASGPIVANRLPHDLVVV